MKKANRWTHGIKNFVFPALPADLKGRHGCTLHRMTFDAAIGEEICAVYMEEPNFVEQFSKVVPFTCPDVDGCLEYGNRGDTLRARFYAVLPDDQPKLDYERVHGCRAAAGKSEAGLSSGMKLENISDSFKIWLPSDAQNPEETALELQGVVGIQVKSPTSYVSYATFTIGRPSKGGSPADITVRASFQGATEPLLPAFRANNSDNSPLDKVKVLQFQVSDVSNPRFQYAAYAFFDKHDTLVAEIDLPVFVNSSR